jgi:nucleoside-diphosphate-sugar epimerase
MLQTILGGNGTIGTVLAKELLSYNTGIRLVSRKPKKINETNEIFPADLTDPAQVDKAVEGSSVVYLLVGLEYNINVWKKQWPKIMQSVIDACIKHNARLVFFDNVYMYDKSVIGHMTEDSPVNPPSKKGAVRKQVADLLLNAVKERKLTALIARAADFYGPHNKTSLLMEMVYKNLKKGKKANWFITGDKKHSFTYTPDAAKATAILGNTPEAFNQVWHLPTHRSILTGKELTGLFAAEMNKPDRLNVLPMWMLKVLGLFIPVLREMPEMMYQYDRDYFFDSAKFENYFEFSPTSYQTGIRETVQQSAL